MVPERVWLGTLASAKFSVVVCPWVTATPATVFLWYPYACAVRL